MSVFTLLNLPMIIIRALQGGAKPAAPAADFCYVGTQSAKEPLPAIDPVTAGIFDHYARQAASQSDYQGSAPFSDR